MNKKFTSLIVLALFIGIIFVPSCEAYFKNENRALLNNHEQATNEILFDKYIELLMRFARKPSASICIIIDEEVIWSKGYGLYDIEKNKKAQPDILYLSASISKTVTATALMQLYEQRGKSSGQVRASLTRSLSVSSPAATSAPRCTRKTRRLRSASTSKSPRACAAFTTPNE